MRTLESWIARARALWRAISVSVWNAGVFRNDEWLDFRGRPRKTGCGTPNFKVALNGIFDVAKTVVNLVFNENSGFE